MGGYTITKVTTIMGVAEIEYKYGEDDFEEFMAKKGDKDIGKVYVDVATIKNEKYIMGIVYTEIRMHVITKYYENNKLNR